MTQEVPKEKGRFDWIFRVETFALMFVMAYYVITEHREHLIEYADYILFGVFVLLFVLIIWHFRQDSNIITKEKKL